VALFKWVFIACFPDAHMIQRQNDHWESWAYYSKKRIKAPRNAFRRWDGEFIKETENVRYTASYEFLRL